MLDAGCGLGELAIELVPTVTPGGRVAAVDSNPDAIARAREAAARAGVDIDFAVADVRDLPFGRESFDVVRSERVFQYLQPGDAAQAASELVRVTRPGGLVQVVDPDHFQMTIAASDREVAHALGEQFAGLSANPESGLLLGGWLRDAGAVEVTVDVHPTVFTRLATFSLVRDLRRELDYLAARGRVDRERGAAFMADLERRDEQGVFLAVVEVYVGTARVSPARRP